MNTLLNAKKLNEHLGKFGFAIKVVSTTGSTNDDLKRAASRLPHLSILVAEHQTQGRGRQTRVFESQEGKGIYLSGLVHTQLKSKLVERLPLILPLALVRVLKNHLNLQAEIKWPNDVRIHGKKVAGILCESSIDSITHSVDLIFGIGINVYAQSFDEGHQKSAGALAAYTDLNLDRNELIIQLLIELSTLMELDYLEVLKEYRKHHLPKGTPLSVQTNFGNYLAVIDEVDDEGALWVLDEQHIRHQLRSEEVHLKVDN